MSDKAVVFVVDDQPLITLTIEHALEDGGYGCLSAASAEEAADLFAAHGGVCRALITDINLGGATSGWEVARRARDRCPALPVIYVTGDSGHEWAVHGVPHSLLVSKPFVASDILQAVDQLLRPPAQAA